MSARVSWMLCYNETTIEVVESCLVISLQRKSSHTIVTPRDQMKQGVKLLDFHSL